MQKKLMFSFILLFLSGLFLLSSCKKTVKTDGNSGKPYVVMLSLDGFRWDYTEHAHTPVLDSLKKAGVFAEMIPSFSHQNLSQPLQYSHRFVSRPSWYCIE